MNTQCYSSARRIGTLENPVTRLVCLSCMVYFALHAVAVRADFFVFGNRATWSADANPNGSEDFNNFTVNTQFRTQPVAVNNMLITGVVGNSGADTNIISVTRDSTSSLYELDSTPFLLGDVEDAQEINLQFTNPVSAWGADFRGIANTNGPIPRRTLIQIFDTNNVLQYSHTPVAGGMDFRQFIGFTSTTTPIGRIVFTDPVIRAGANFDVFAVDNIQFTVTAVPEPSSLMLLGMLTTGLATWMRRRNQQK